MAVKYVGFVFRFLFLHMHVPLTCVVVFAGEKEIKKDVSCMTYGDLLRNEDA